MATLIGKITGTEAHILLLQQKDLSSTRTHFTQEVSIIFSGGDMTRYNYTILILSPQGVYEQVTIDGMEFDRLKHPRAAGNPDAFPPQHDPPPASRLRWDKVFTTWQDFQLVQLMYDLNLSETKMAKLLKVVKDPRMRPENITLKDANHIKMLMDDLAAGNAEQVSLYLNLTLLHSTEAPQMKGG